MNTTRARRSGGRRTGQKYEQIVIEAVSPSIDGAQYPVKGIVGDLLPVEATVYRQGHERVRAAVLWKAPGGGAFRETPMTLVNPGLDRWRGELRLEKAGRYGTSKTSSRV
jgi:starch synthase (maltosyl-transferring)